MLNKYLNGKIAEMIEHGLLAGSTLLVAHGVNQSDASGLTALINPQALAGFLVACLNLAWGMYRKHKDNTLINAVATGAKGGQVQMSVSRGLSAVVLAFGLLTLAALPMRAQTNAPLSTNSSSLMAIPLLNLPVSTNTVKAANDLLVYLEPLIPYLTNKTVRLDAAPVYDGGHWGGLADLQVPITGALSLGGGGAYIDDQWFVVAASTQLGTSFTVPVINLKGYAFAETGLAIPLKSAQIENQSVAGATFSWPLSSSLILNVEGGVIKETSLPGVAEFFGASLTWHW